MLNLASLNPQQRLAAETIRGPVLILAGAGTGKTRVITCRIGHMIAKGIAPDHILAVTFTNKAAREMQERVQELVPTRRARQGEEKPPRPTIGTFHSLCVRILRQHIERLGYKRNFVIYSESEQLSAIKKVLSSISAKGEKIDPYEILSLISRAKNGNPGSIGPNTRVLLDIVQRRYESALHACNAVDFDDLILLTLRLFEEHPDALEACRARFQYVMVDEYQDTNAAQFRLVYALTQEHRNLCVVGDDDQSIYGWRGAEIANLLELEKYFPEVKVVKLEQNYRSTNTILNAANALIKNNPNRRGKQLWSQKGPGEKIVLHTFENEEEEARTIVEEIEMLRLTNRAAWQDQAILFRTNMQARPLETALRQSKVRYHLIGGQSYFDRREVKDFLAYLRTFLNPNDDISLLRIANVPARGLSDNTMEQLLAASQERKCSVHAAMKNPLVLMSFQARIRQSIEAFLEFIEEQRGLLTAQPNLNLSLWADNFLARSGYLEELRRSEKEPEAGDARVRSVKDLAADLERAEEGAIPALERLTAFLEEITLDNERAEEKEAKGDAVTLITMHSCKGLEYPHVYVVGLENGLLPHSRSQEEGTMDEERRLFYVAITRAMKSLAISHCTARKKYGQTVACHPSPFLKELPEHLLELASEKAKEPVTVNTGKNLFAGMRAALG